jgi:hypothetical protein
MADSEKISKSIHFICNNCDYSTYRKSQYERHLSTTKHKINSNNTSVKSEKQEYKCSCGKIYKYDSGYYRHKKLCIVPNKNNNNQNTIISLHNELNQKINEVFEIIKKINLLYSIDTEKI